MKTQFECHEYFSGVYHIGDVTGVHFTLIILKEAKQAVLFDCGYGLVDVKSVIVPLLEKHSLDIGRLRVIISHIHRDHVFGARWFDSFYVHEADVVLLDTYTDKGAREGALQKFLNNQLVLDGFDESAFYHDDYHRRIRVGIPSFDGIDIVHLPGHTPGSVVLFIPEHRLLLTADNWNPTTWLFFPEALPVEEYTENMKSLLSFNFEHVLCSHSGELVVGKRLRDYINGLTADNFSKAVATTTPYPEIKTLLCHPEPGTNFIFRGK
ncbi:MBL fold metallo-hydrolase [Spirochaetia bacterium]|nr:MBL fold metallo-hydrolase [Spirochaetia bacterium]